MRWKTSSKPNADTVSRCSQEAFPPQPQCLGVVRADGRHVDGAQPRVASGDAGDRFDGRQESAGEDVLLDPGIRVARRQHSAVGHRDGLDRHPSTGGHQPVEGLEVRRPEVVADGLDHLHRDHRVVAAVDVAVVEQIDLDAIREACGRDPLSGQLLLLGRQRDRSDRGAARRRTDAQLTPAGADLQHAAAGADLRGVEQAVDLAPLGVGQLRSGGRQGVEEGAGVGQRLVEELPEQLIGQIVVLGDVLTSLFAVVELRTRLADNGDRPEPLKRPGNEVVHRPRELGEHTRQVVGAPLARHVGLAETDEAVAADPSRQRVGAMNHHRRQCRVCGADDRAVGIDHAQRQARRGIAEQALRRSAPRSG